MSVIYWTCLYFSLIPDTYTLSNVSDPNAEVIKIADELSIFPAQNLASKNLFKMNETLEIYRKEV